MKRTFALATPVLTLAALVVTALLILLVDKHVDPGWWRTIAKASIAALPLSGLAVAAYRTRHAWLPSEKHGQRLPFTH